MNWKKLLRICFILIGLALTGTVLAQVSAQYDLSWNILSSGGGQRSSTNYKVDDALGQWALGTSSGPNYRIDSGFFYGASSAADCHPLTLTHIGSGFAPIASPAKSDACAANGQYLAGEAISLSANPAGGWVVNGWSGTADDASTSSANLLIMPPNPHTVQVVYQAQGDSFENDDACSQAKTIDVTGNIQERTFHAAGDADWVRFDVTQDIQYRIEVQSPIQSPADVDLGVYPACDTDPSKTFEETFTPGVVLDFTAPSTGSVYLRLTNYDPAVAGPDVAYRLSVRSFEPDAPKGAVIILAGRLKLVDRVQPNIHYVTDAVYKLYKQQGYDDDEIQYLAVDPALPGVDKSATVANLRDAITSWAVGRVGPQKPLIIYMMDHGAIDKLFVDEVNQQNISPSDLNSWLDQLEAAVPGVKITVVIEACYSGSFIDGEQSSSSPGRAIISSTDAANVAYASADGAQFSDHFITSLSQGNGFCMSFRNAQDSVQQISSIQRPWIDSNGNKVPNETFDCEAADLLTPLAGQLPSDSWAPYIVGAQGPVSIIDQKGTISAQVRDNQSVARVWAVIYTPSYIAQTSGQELVPIDVPTLNLLEQSSEMYSAEYTKFNELGLYRIAVYAQDNSGLISGPIMLQVVNGRLMFLPILTK